MSDKENPGLHKENPSPATDEHPDESSPKSYYYDDATGYEIYQEESDDDDDADRLNQSN